MPGELRGPDVSEHLQRLLRDGEEVTWHAKPDKTSFYITSIVGGLVAAAFLGGFFGLWGTAAVGAFAAFLWGEQAALWSIGGFVTLLVLGIPAALVAATARQYAFAEYAVTDDRVIEVSGLFGRDSSTISLSDIRDIDVSVGLTDKVFGTGSLEFQTAGGSDSGTTFNQVNAPYVALQQIEDSRHEAEQRAREVSASPGSAA